MAFQTVREHLLSAGIGSWRIQAEGDSGFYTFGTLQSAKLILRSLTERDSCGRPHAYGAELEASARVLNTHASLLSLLGTLGGKRLAHIIDPLNGQRCWSGLLADPFWGFQWKLTSDRNADGARYLEIRTDRRLTCAEIPLLFQAAPPDPPQLIQDVLSPLQPQQTEALQPAGLKAVELRAAGQTPWSDELGILKAGKFSAELLSVRDHWGRSTGYGVRISVQADAMQTSSIELNAARVLAERANDVRVTLADGATMTFLEELGVRWELHNEDDATDTAFLRIEGEGIIPLAAWGGIWS